MNLEKIKLLDTNLYHILISDYLSSKDQLKSFVRQFPEDENLINYARNKAFDQKKRKVLSSVLLEQYNNIDKSEKVSRNLESLLEENTYTITTGHQLCLATGPLYFIVKICSTIALCNRLNAHSPELNLVPVYWMASEDHDFEEINHFKVFSKTYSWSNGQDGAVGKMDTEGIENILKELEENLGEEYKESDLAGILKLAYASDNLALATRILVDKLFGKYGLIIIDGDDRELKKEFAPIMKKEIIEDEVYTRVNQSIQKLKNSAYKIQVNAREINLFYLEENSRKRIIKEGNSYGVVNQDTSWTEEEILNEIELHPDRFSPNVILRPMYQEVVLPNLAYIGGGGEISYWLELKDAFDQHQVDFPILIVRDSVMFISKAIQKKIEKLNLSKSDLFASKDMIVKQVLPENDQIKIDDFRSSIARIYEEMKDKVSEFDKSLGMSVDSEKTKTIKGLDNLDKKMIRGLKRKNEDLINQVDSIKEKLFPNGGLQERQFNFIQFYLEFGEDLIPMLIGNLNPINKELLLISKEQ